MSLRIARSLLLVLCCAAAHHAQAQPVQTEVIVTESGMSNDALEILHSALEREGIALRRSSETAACSGRLHETSDGAVRARVWLRWSEHTVTLCFQDRCQSSERVLGHFAQLDARAREEIITVIGSGLAALPFACPAESPNAPADQAHAPARNRSAPAADERAMAEQSARSAPPRTADSALRPPDAPLATSEPPGASTPRAASTKPPASTPRAASEPAPDGARRSQRRASTLPGFQDELRLAAEDADDDSQRKLLFSARYGITRWSVDVLSQQLGAGAAYELHRYPVFVGIELDYAPAFRVGPATLGLDVSGLRLAVQLWTRWSLSGRVVLDAQFGPALDWLWLTPQAATARELREPRSSAHADPAVFARVGPALYVYKGLLIGVDLQLDAAFIARSYGFSADAEQREVFSPDRIRMSIALHARAEL